MARSKDPDRLLVRGMHAVAAGAVVVLGLGVYGLFSSSPAGDPAADEPAGQETSANGDRPSLTAPDLRPVLAGRVVDSAGSPIAAVIVTVGAELMAPGKDEEPGVLVGTAEVTGTTDADGRFAMGGMANGLHRIRIEGASVVTSEVRYVSLPTLDLQITALRRVTITGRVARGQVSGPLGEIRVTARGEIEEASAVAAADGSFTVSGISEGIYRVWAESDRAASAAVRLEARGAGPFGVLELELLATFVVSGRIFEAGGASPVAGQVLFTSDVEEPERRVLTDADGRYAVSTLIPGRWSAQATAPGFVPSEQLAFEADRDRSLDLFVSAGGIIEGVALDADGAPVTGALIEVSSASVDEATAGTKRTLALAPAAAPGTQFIPRGELGVLLGPIPFPPPEPITSGRIAQPVIAAAAAARDTGDRISDEAGRFRVTGLRAGIYQVGASHSDFAGGVTEGVTVSLGKTTSGVVITMRKGVRIVGLVREAGGGPIQGAQLSAHAPGGAMTRAVTDSDGRYRLPPVLGAVTVDVTALGYARQRGGAPIAADGSEIELDFALVRADRAVAGRVVDSSKFPVRSATVQIGGAAAVTDDDGRFEIVGLASGDHELAIRHPQFPPTTAKVTADAANELVIDIGGGISGAVREAKTGRPVPWASLEARSGDVAVPIKANELGEYAIGPIAAGRWTLTVVAAGYARHRETIEVSQGRTPGETTVRDHRIELSVGAIIGGVVLDENGERVHGAVVKVGDLETSSDIEGRFRIRDVPSGRVHIEVVAGARQGQLDVDVDGGDDRSTIDLRIAPR